MLPSAAADIARPATMVTCAASGTIVATYTVMIGSIDMFASINSMPVTSIAMTGRLSGMPRPAAVLRGRVPPGWPRVLLIRNEVARNATKMIAPAARKVIRMPINGGRTPPISGPARFPAMMPDDITPSAQAVCARGVCVATRMVEPEIAAQQSCQQPQADKLVYVL